MLKRFFAYVFIFLLFVAAILGFATYRASQLPDWAVQAASADTEEPESPGGLAGALGGLLGVDMGSARTAIWLAQRLFSDGRVEVDAPGLVDVTSTALGGTRNGRHLLQAAGALQARIADGSVLIGAFVDLADVDPEQLDEDLAPSIRKLNTWAPTLRGRKVWLALESRPGVRDGDLALGDDATIWIGRLALPRWVAREFGIDERLRKQLTIDLRVLELESASVQDDKLVLES